MSKQCKCEDCIVSPWSNWQLTAGMHLLDHQQHMMLENFHIPDLKLGLTKMHPRLMRDLLQIKGHHRYSH